MKSPKLLNHLRSILRSKLYSDTVLMLHIIKYLDTVVSNFAKISIPILLIVYLIRGFVNGTFIPYSITYIVNGLKDENKNVLQAGLILLLASSVIFAITEIAQMNYFKKLTRSIISLKKHILSKIVRKDCLQENPEELVGKVASDVDFIVWNINAVLTTLLPNLFTALTALITIYSFNTTIGLITATSTIPYVIYAEIYTKRVEVYRALERKTYAQSIVHIKNIIYGEKVDKDLDNILKKWEYSVNKMMWLDRFYFSASLATSLLSVSGVALLASREVSSNKLSIGALSGILYASITAHFGMLNAMWAFCIQGQTVSTLKRIVNYLLTSEKEC